MNVEQETLGLRRAGFSPALTLLMSAFALLIPPVVFFILWMSGRFSGGMGSGGMGGGIFSVGKSKAKIQYYFSYTANVGNIFK